MSEKPEISRTQATLGYAILEIASSPRRMLLLLLAIPVVIVMVWAIIFACLLTVRLVYPGPLQVGDVSLSPPNVAPTTKYFLLSANGGVDSPWIDTGMQVRSGQRVQISASGRVNLAIHRLNEAAATDALPPLPWNGPGGIRVGDVYPPYQPRQKETDRSPYRIDPHLPQGRLIGTISNERPRPRPPEGVIDIGTGKNFEARETGRLWLTVNEIWLHERLGEAYTEHSPEEFEAKIVGKRYWNVWFDDNAGSFLVAILVTES